MQLLKKLFLFLSLSACFCYAEDLLIGHQQLIVVTTSNWEEKKASLQLYERRDDGPAWTLISGPIPVVIGKAGLAWGIGLHPKSSKISPFKREGDGKSPAGIFSLGGAFGFACKMPGLKIDYFQLDEFTEAVDDPLSSYYNYIVNSKEITTDWNSSEKMRSVSLYKIGLVINHNFPNPQKNAGSAIFFHIWRNENSGTAGCTAMSQENLTHLLLWLEKSKNPVLVQLPISSYYELQSDWELPNL